MKSFTRAAVILGLCVAVSACSGDGSDDQSGGAAASGGSTSGGGASSNGGGPSNNAGTTSTPSDGSCNKGAYPTDGEILFCETDGDGCVAIEKARGYTSFYGNVKVSGVRDLSALACWRSMGELSLSNMTGLKDLKALAGITRVSRLSLVDNPDLQSLEGLDGLSKLEFLGLIDTGLTDFRGLRSGFVLDGLGLEYHKELVALTGFKDIKITNYLGISNNPKLPECLAQAEASKFPDLKTTIIKKNNTAATCD